MAIRARILHVLKHNCVRAGMQSQNLTGHTGTAGQIGTATDINDTTPNNLSFAGCGFLGIYHLGVAETLGKHGSNFLSNIQSFTGASAGALVAAALAVTGTEKIEDCVKFCCNLASDVHKKKLGVLTPRLSLLGPLEAFLRELLPPDGYKIATDRLFVSITSIETRKNMLVSKFESNEELIKCLLASSYVPFMTGTKPVVIGEKKFMDGGLTDNLPILAEGRTVCVSPFAGKQDICPTDKKGKSWYCNINNQDFKVNVPNVVRGLHAFFPPKQRELQFYYERGMRDAENFLKKENIYEEMSTKSSMVTGSPRKAVKETKVPTVQYVTHI